MNAALITIGLIIALGVNGDTWTDLIVQSIGVLIMLLATIKRIEV